MKFTTLHTIDTVYSADSIEWCPCIQFRDHFVCGTYQLENSKENESAGIASGGSVECRRKGRIYLYKFNDETHELVELQRFETGAILDMKWRSPASTDAVAAPILATANALGQIEMYELIATDDVATLQLRCSFDLNADAADGVERSGSVLALSLDWDTKSNMLTVSDSKGQVNLLEYSSTGTLRQVQKWHGHDFESWICAFDRWDATRVYSGGDDCKLLAYDIRTQSRIWTNKLHMAGVTCLLSHPQREHILLTGSYDENLRLFDTRSMKRTLAELPLGGGIWRLKAHPLRSQLILAACMYQNFSVIDIDNDNGQLSLAGVFEEHESICYGADWCQNISTGQSSRALYMATCSFYDHKLCLAKIVE